MDIISLGTGSKCIGRSRMSATGTVHVSAELLQLTYILYIQPIRGYSHNYIHVASN